MTKPTAVSGHIAALNFVSWFHVKGIFNSVIPDLYIPVIRMRTNHFINRMTEDHVKFVVSLDSVVVFKELVKDCGIKEGVWQNIELGPILVGNNQDVTVEIDDRDTNHNNSGLELDFFALRRKETKMQVTPLFAKAMAWFSQI